MSPSNRCLHHAPLRVKWLAGLLALPLLVVSLIAGRVVLAEPAPEPGVSASVVAPSAAPTIAPTAPPSAAPKPTAGRAPVPPIDPVPTDALVYARSTPRRALTAFVRYCTARDFAHAADFLDLRAVAREHRDKEGAELAEKLYRVLTWRVAVDPELYPDEPTVEAGRVLLDTVDLEGTPVEIAIAPVKRGTENAWQFTKETVANVRALYDLNQRRWFEEHVPKLLRENEFAGLAAWQWVGLLVLLTVASLIAVMGGRAVTWLALRALARGPEWMRALAQAWRSPNRVALFALTVTLAAPYLVLPKRGVDIAGYIEVTLYILAIAWASIGALHVGTTGYIASLPNDADHELANRGLKTRLNMVRRIGGVLIGMVAVGIALLQFDVVRNIGLSLLASAGIAGVLVGFAAQRTLGGIISGIEISITQPLRMGDIVTFDGVEGVVERIYFTYVVIRTGDDRRLIVPVAQVMSRSFENLTLTGADLLVYVDVFVDYETPIDAVRAEFERLCKEQNEWDGRRASIVVLECTDKAIKLRGIASTDDAAKGAVLRAALREHLVRYLQALEGGRYLPRGRVTSIERSTG